MICIVFLSKLIKNDDRNDDPSTFEFHFIINFIFDILQTISILFFQKFLHWGLFTDLYLKSNWLDYCYALFLYSNIASAIIGNMICVTNRYFALCHCNIYMKKWTLKWSICLVIFQFFFPILLFSFNLWFIALPVYAPPFHIYIYMVQDKLASAINNAFISLLSGGASLVGIYMNLTVAYKYNKLMVNISKKERAKRISMVLYAIFNTITLAALSVQQLIRIIFVLQKYQLGLYYVTYYLFIIIPMMACIQPYLLLILSKSVRIEFLLFYSNVTLLKKLHIISDKSILKSSERIKTTNLNNTSPQQHIKKNSYI